MLIGSGIHSRQFLLLLAFAALATLLIAAKVLLTNNPVQTSLSKSSSQLSGIPIQSPSADSQPATEDTIKEDSGQLKVQFNSHSTSSSKPANNQVKTELKVNGTTVPVSGNSVHKTVVSSDGNSSVHVSIDSSSSTVEQGDGM